MSYWNLSKIKGCFNFVTQNINIFSGRSTIVPLVKFIEKLPAEVDFMQCDKSTQAITALREQRDDVQVVALGGMGKTRLLYEAFKDAVPENAYYCYHSQGDAFVKDLEHFFQDDTHNDGLLVLDDCPNESILYARSERANHGSNIRLVYAHHDYFEKKNFPDTIMVEFTSGEMREEVDKYIQNEVLRTDEDQFICERIKELAEGYPQMAILLVNAYKKNGRIGVQDVESLMEVLLGRNDDNQMKALKCLSLFQPLGYKAPVEQQFKTVLGNSILTGLFCSEAEKVDIFDRCIQHFKGEIVEEGGPWLNVRPLPLAIWLVGKWLEEHSEDRLMQLIGNFEQLPQRLASQLGSQMYRRLRNMEGNENARLLIGELCKRYSNSPFGAEGVVCSELGSRLFLAFAYVNHMATAQCIHGVVESKSIDELKENVQGNIRRNIIRTLEKLCYPVDSFPLAADDMLKLAVAENEGIGNNATGQYLQLFHVFLPGTEATLQDRVAFLKNAISREGEYLPLLVKSLSSALLTGSFTRMGGAEDFGSIKRVDYAPKTEGEITEYWGECANILIEILHQYPDTLPDIKRVVEERSYQLMREGRVEIVDKLVKAVLEKEQGEWMEMYSHFYDIKRSIYIDYPEVEKAIIDKWIELLKPKSYSNELKEVRIKVFEHNHKNYSDEFEYAQGLLAPLVQKFIEEHIYEKPEEVRALMLEEKYVDFGFTKMLTGVLTDDQLVYVLEEFKVIIEEKGDNVFCPFFYTFCQHLRGRAPFEVFLAYMRDHNHTTVYVHLLTNVEDELLSVMTRLKDEIKRQQVSEEAIKLYLYQAGWMTPEMLMRVLNDEEVKKLTTPTDLMLFVEKFQYGRSLNDTPELLKMVKEILLKYEYDENTPSNNREYANFLMRVLELDQDGGFAKAVCNRLIEQVNTNYIHGAYEHVFYSLLNKYIDDIWDEFSEKFVDEAYAPFFYQVKDEVGSGFHFGSGVMYQHGMERIKELCLKHPERAPYCVALTCPVFNYKDDGNGNMVREDRYSDILIWVLENYGHQSNTLDGASGNIGSFSWAGSPIGLFNSHIASLKLLVVNPKMDGKVKKWADMHIKYFEGQIKDEQGRMDFERMHYQ